MSSNTLSNIRPKATSFSSSDGREKPKSSTVKPHAKYVATACEACKKAKRKCDGKKPCQTCVDKGNECVFDETKDGRRGRKRNLVELYAKVEAFDAVLDSIRSTDDTAVADLIKLIRDEASVEEIASHARGILKASAPHGSRDRTRTTIMSIASLTDEPPIRVSASPWTTITDDDNFVSHMISVYFTWHHESYPAVYKDIFIKAMIAGDTSSQFCSPFLVNCMLLTACLYSNHPLVYAFDNDNASRGAHFADEVARLWSIEEGRASLTNLQGLVILSLGLGVLRKDRLAMTYTRQMPILCIELSRKVKHSIKNGSADYISPDYQASMQLARWSAFQMEVDFCMIWFKPLQLHQPRIQRPHIGDDLVRTEAWRPYPKIGPEVAYHPYGLREAKFDLREIGADIIPIILSGEPDDSPAPGFISISKDERMERLDQLLQRLTRWHANLPSYAVPSSEATPAWPQVELLLVYHDYVIVVHSLMLRDAVTVGSKRQEAKLGLLRSCEDITQIFEWVQRTLGTSAWCIWGFQPAAMAAYPLLDMLTEIGVADIFHTIIVSIFTVAKRWILARGVLRMLWITIQERRIVDHLNGTTIQLFRESAVEQWGPNDHRLFESCIYPNYAAIAKDGRELADMGDLLQKWSRFNIT